MENDLNEKEAEIMWKKLKAAKKRVAELEDKCGVIQARNAYLETHIAELEGKTTHQEEIAKGFNGLLTWGNRVAAEYGIVGTQSNFAFIERTLKEQRERIAELELEAFELKRKIAIREATIKRVKDENENLTHHLELRTNFLNHAQMQRDELRALNIALVSQSAGGAGVTWEYDLDTRDTLHDVRLYLNKRSTEGWEFVEPLIASHNKWVVCVRRPARNESERIYPSDTMPDAWGMGGEES
jgi:hypothetical protein